VIEHEAQCVTSAKSTGQHSKVVYLSIVSYGART
jgi:hypothetical protein